MSLVHRKSSILFANENWKLEDTGGYSIQRICEWIQVLNYYKAGVIA